LVKEPFSINAPLINALLIVGPLHRVLSNQPKAARNKKAPGRLITGALWSSR
jgi:hypothetical protein